MKLSDQALGAIMMALQKSLMEQTDIVPVLKDFNFELNHSLEEGQQDELVVENPPTVKFDDVQIADTSSPDDVQVI